MAIRGEKVLDVWLTTAGALEKKNIMRSFGEGAAKHGVKVRCDLDAEYGTFTQPRFSNYALIFAYKSDGIETASHRLRQKIVDTKIDKQIFFVDSNVLKAYESKNNKYFRLPYRSIHPHEADFLKIDDSTYNRIDRVKKDMGVEMKPMRTGGGHIVLSLNRGFGGFSTFGKPCYEWALETVKKIRKYTDRKIIIRSHMHAKHSPDLQQDKLNLTIILNKFNNIEHTAYGETSLIDNLKNAWACVVYTSTSGAVALLEGVPVFTSHPACFYSKFSSGDISNIENPKLVDRDSFFIHYVNAHWNIEDMSSGKFWEKFKRYNYENPGN